MARKKKQVDHWAYFGKIAILLIASQILPNLFAGIAMMILSILGVGEAMFVWMILVGIIAIGMMAACLLCIPIVIGAWIMEAKQ